MWNRAATDDVFAPVTFSRLACFTLLLGAATLAHGAEPDARFSQTLVPETRNAAGMAKLTSDEIAVLDALVRRDATQVASQASSAPTFSQRLTVDEYRAAGLGRLTAPELVHLDAAVASREADPAAPTAVLSSPGMRVTAADVRDSAPWKPEVHGEVFIEFGGGRGFSTRGGGVTLTIDDPTHRSTLSLGYAEWRARGR